MSLIKVIKKVGGQKKYGVEYGQNPSLNSVARLVNSQSGDIDGFANMVLGSNKRHLEVPSNLYDVEPMIPMKNEGFGIVISGEKRTGKSTMGTLLTKQYAETHPKNALYFVSQKKKK